MTDHEFRITFGSQYTDDNPHPRHEDAHRDGWFTVLITNVPDDRDEWDAEMVARVAVGNGVLDRMYSNIYDAAKFKDDEHYYPRGELAKYVIHYADEGTPR